MRGAFIDMHNSVCKHFLIISMINLTVHQWYSRE